MSIRLSTQARHDLDTIRDYTEKTWGRAQWLRYFVGMAAAFDRIAAYPDCGRPRDLFRAKMRSLTYEKHLIFFLHPLPMRVVPRSSYASSMSGKI